MVKFGNFNFCYQHINAPLTKQLSCFLIETAQPCQTVAVTSKNDVETTVQTASASISTIEAFSDDAFSTLIDSTLIDAFSTLIDSTTLIGKQVKQKKFQIFSLFLQDFEASVFYVCFANW